MKLKRLRPSSTRKLRRLKRETRKFRAIRRAEACHHDDYACPFEALELAADVPAWRGSCGPCPNRKFCPDWRNDDLRQLYRW